MSTPAFAEIYMPCIPSMCLTDCASQTIFRSRHSNKMNMVRHQAVCPDLDGMIITPFCHKASIQPVVFVLKKSRLPAITTLSYMMRKVGGHNPCDSCHAI